MTVELPQIPCLSEYSESSEELDELNLHSESTSDVLNLKSPSSSKLSHVEEVFDHETALTRIALLNSRCSELQMVENQIKNSQREITAQIDHTMTILHRAIENRREELLQNLATRFEHYLTEVKGLLYNFECRSQRLSAIVREHSTACLDKADSASSNHMEEFGSHIYQKKTAVNYLRKDDVDHLMNAPISLHPAQTDTLSFFPCELDRALGTVRVVGTIGICSADPNRSTLANYYDEHSIVKRCEVNELVVTPIIGLDQLDREVLNMQEQDITVHLSPRETNRYEAKVVRAHPRQPYSPLHLVYSVATPGVYDLSVKLFGEHIHGSPYMLWCKKPAGPTTHDWIEAFEFAGRYAKRHGHIPRSPLTRCDSAPKLSFWVHLGNLSAEKLAVSAGDLINTIHVQSSETDDNSSVQGVIVTRDKKIVVADSHKACIHVFSEEGEFRLRFGEPGPEPGQLILPIDVAETINGNYLISDFGSHCVNVYSPKGKYISRFGQRYLDGPKGIAVDSKGRILVADQKCCMVCIFKPTGKFISRFGSRGSEDACFICPNFVAVNQQDEIFVSDSLANAVKVFDPAGVYLASIGKNGIENGHLHSPMGVAIGPSGEVFVVDQANRRVQIFARDGRFVRRVNLGSERCEQLNALTLSKDAAKIVITDPGCHNIKIYANKAP